MILQNLSITPEYTEQDEMIERLAESAFGPGRFARTAFRLRDGIPHLPELSFVACINGLLIGSVRLTAIKIGDQESLLLGPLVVEPAYKNSGTGKLLMQKSVDAARQAGHSSILLVGDEPYYRRFGFRKVPSGSITMPGPVDPARLLICPLQNDRITQFTGMVRTSRA